MLHEKVTIHSMRMIIMDIVRKVIVDFVRKVTIKRLQ